MYTEHAFDEIEFYLASRYLKAMGFDVSKIVNDKLSVPNEMISCTDDPELKAKLEEKVKEMENSLADFLNGTSQLVSLMEKLDSFSKDLDYLKNQNLARIVANIQNKDEELNQEYVSEEEKQETMEENQEAVEDEILEDEKEETFDDSQEMVNEEVSEVEDSNVESEDISPIPSIEMSNADEQEVEASEDLDVSSDEPMDVPVDQENEQDEDSMENVSDSTDEVSEENIIDDGASEDVVEETENTEDIFSNNIDQEINSIVEESAPIDENDETAVVTDGIIPQISEQGDTVTVDQQAQVIPTEDSTIVEQEVAPVEGQAVISTEEAQVPEIVADTQQENVAPTEVVAEPVFTQEVVDNAPEISVTFKKINTNEPRAILTSAAQIEHLRLSRGNQESILAAKQFFNLENAQEGEVNEQQLIDNGLLPPVEGANEEQINQMTQQITQLYNEGRIDEAQALSDKVSELSKGMQQTQNAMVA